MQNYDSALAKEKLGFRQSGVFRYQSDGASLPAGDYVTIPIALSDDKLAAAQLVACELAALLGDGGVLFAGLGNRNVLCDSLGARTIDKISVFGGRCRKAQLATEKQSGFPASEHLRLLAGGLGVTAVAVIDALAAKNAENLFSGVQLSSAGIVPGSGAGARSAAVTEKTVGVRVVWLGVPTAIRAEALTGAPGDQLFVPHDAQAKLEFFSDVAAAACNILSARRI